MDRGVKHKCAVDALPANRRASPEAHPVRAYELDQVCAQRSTYLPAPTPRRAAPAPGQERMSPRTLSFDRKRRGSNHAEVTEGWPRVGTTTLPSPHDVIAFCDETAAWSVPRSILRSRCELLHNFKWKIPLRYGLIEGKRRALLGKIRREPCVRSGFSEYSQRCWQRPAP